MRFVHILWKPPLVPGMGEHSIICWVIRSERAIRIGYSYISFRVDGVGTPRGRSQIGSNINHIKPPNLGSLVPSTLKPLYTQVERDVYSIYSIVFTKEWLDDSVNGSPPQSVGPGCQGWPRTEHQRSHRARPWSARVHECSSLFKSGPPVWSSELARVRGSATKS